VRLKVFRGYVEILSERLYEEPLRRVDRIGEDDVLKLKPAGYGEEGKDLVRCPGLLGKEMAVMAYARTGDARGSAGVAGDPARRSIPRLHGRLGGHTALIAQRLPKEP